MKREELLKLWERYSHLVELDQEEWTIDTENDIICTIEKNLPFKDQQEHERWLSLSIGDWEDWEKLTLAIINRKEEQEKMRFTYKGRIFQLAEIKEIGTNASYDIVTIFEVKKDGDYESLTFVNYFYGVSDNLEELKEISVPYIEGYFKQCQLNDLIIKLKDAYDNFQEDFKANNSTKGSLDKLEYAQSDLLEFIDENM